MATNTITKSLQRNMLNANIGEAFTQNEIQATLKHTEDRAFITFLMGCWEVEWFPLIINGKHMKFDDEITMEFCRQHFGHTRFGISNGEQASIGNTMRDNF